MRSISTSIAPWRNTTTFSSVRLDEIGGIQRTIVAMHGQGYTPRTRLSYLTPSDAPILEATIYLFPDWGPQILDAIARARAGEKVDLYLGTAPPVRVWSASEGGDRGLAFRLLRRPPGARSTAPAPAPLPPTVAIVADELTALERALRAVQALSLPSSTQPPRGPRP